MRESRVVRWLVPRVTEMRVDWPLVLLDAALVALAYVAAMFLRFEGSVPPEYVRSLLFALPVVTTIHLGANAAWGLYGCVWAQASVDEARRVVTAGAFAGLVVLSLVLARELHVPLLSAASGSGLSLLLFAGARFQARVFSFRRATVESIDEPPHRAILVGAGASARVLLRSLQDSPADGITPLALVDDDPRLHGRTLGGVPVLGGLEEIPAAAALYGATMVIIAAPEAGSETIARVAAAALEADLAVKILPSWSEMLGTAASAQDLRDLDITDLLGRKQIATDLSDVRAMLAGRRVLITGGGGSIGSEIARQVAAFEPSELILLDNDETHLHDTLATLPATAKQVLADVRDRGRIEQAFRSWRPDVVFHAAALKHVPVLEDHPCEGIATNILGSHNVIRAAVASGVRQFVLISTDKAVEPVNVMGATKRVCEQLLLTERPAGSAFSVVRFGNVLGSRGSVVPSFLRQIRQGGPVTVTHPDVERFFMSIPEASHLVLHAAAQSTGGDLFMLDMGEPVRILDLARRMIELSGRADVQVRFTGLRPGEKLSEELSEPDERSTPTRHPSVHRLQPNVIGASALHAAVDELAAMVHEQRDEDATRCLFALVDDVRATSTIDLTDATAALAVRSGR